VRAALVGRQRGWCSQVCRKRASRARRQLPLWGEELLDTADTLGPADQESQRGSQTRIAATLAVMSYRIDATYRPYSNAELLSDDEMDRRVHRFRSALGPDDRANGNPDLLVVTVIVSAESDDEARMIGAERLQEALDKADLRTFQTINLDVTRI
jgi:hypothetical protein